MKKNRIIVNSAWIIGCRVVQSLLGVVITMLTARYLGPSNYGLINYASSLVAFVAPIGKLGLDSILVNEFISHPDREGETLGTSIILSFASSLLCMLGLAGFVAIANPGEADTLLVCVLYSIVLLAHAAELTQFWFQAHLLSKYTSIATLAAYLAKSAYQICLLVNGSSIYWFALTNALDISLIAAIIFVIYRRKHGQGLKFSRIAAGRMLSQSKYYIVSSMMVTIFANTDRIMIKMMLGDAQTGYYSAAVACASLTSFVFSAIISSVRPVALEKVKNDESVFDKTMVVLYSVVIQLSLIQCIVISVFSPLVIGVLYGDTYSASISPLRWIVWYTTFSYLGSVRNVWILARQKQKILWKLNSIGALGNVILNFLLIPLMGINGAAIASLITQIITNVGLCFVIKDLRPTLRYVVMGCNPKNVLILLDRSIK